MAKRYNNYKKNYNNSYNNSNYGSRGNYSQQSDKLMVGTPQYRKRVRWGMTIAIIIASALVVGLTAFFTNSFYSDNVQAWDMMYGWCCPKDNTVYAKNYNALISRENYAVEQNGKTLTVCADFEKAQEIEVNERLYVRFSVVYYKGEESVGQSVYYNLPSNLTGESAIIWSYDEACKTSAFNDLGVDSVKLAVVYEYEGKDISLLQKSSFSNVFVLKYE